MMIKYALTIIAAVLLCIPAVSAVYPGDPGFRGCVISNVDGVFQDSDCDRIPDILDNCPLRPNPELSDVDRNGIGDACDLIIDELIIEPEEPVQGRSALIRASIFNNRDYPMRNMVMRAEIPRLGVAVTQPLSVLGPGERVLVELLLRIPECAPPVFTDFVVFAEYPYAPGQKEIFSTAVKVPVIMSGVCEQNPSEELTVVEILELQDVLPEQGAYYPFTIENNWPESKAYILSVQGVESWGNAEIQPGSVMVVPPGGSREGSIHVWAYRGEEGAKSFTFSVNARDDAKQILLQADVKQLKQFEKPRQSNQILTGVLTFLAILVLIGVVLLFMNKKERQYIHNELEKEQRTQTTPQKKPKKNVKKPAVKKKGKKK